MTSSRSGAKLDDRIEQCWLVVLINDVGHRGPSAHAHVSGTRSAVFIWRYDTKRLEKLPAASLISSRRMGYKRNSSGEYLVYAPWAGS